MEKWSSYLYGSHFIYLNLVLEAKINPTVGGKQREDLTNIFKALDTMKQIKPVFCDFGQLLVLIIFRNVCATAASTPVN